MGVFSHFSHHIRFFKHDVGYLSIRFKEQKMKKVIVLITLCLLAGLVISSTFGQEANEPPPPPERYYRIMAEGTVIAVKDANGNLTEVFLQTETVKYSVILDERGRQLGALEGKKARVMGRIHIEGEVEWLTVRHFEEIVAEPPAPPKESPK